MTTDILAAAIPTPTDPDCLDLGALFAPLQREEIEVMIVKLLNKYPDEAGWIVQTARKPVDTLEISNEVATTISTGTSISFVCDEIENYITRSSDYLKSGHVRNAVAVLEAITTPVSIWTSEQGSLDEMESEDKSTLEGFFALLENAWQAIIEQCQVVESAAGSKPTGVASKTTLTRSSGAEKQAKQRAGKLTYQQLAKNEMEFHSQLLTEAKKKLTATIGPMFSDPLRSLNKKRALPGLPAPTTAAPTSAAAAPVVGSKRKGESKEDEAEPAAAESSSSSSTTTTTAATEPPTKKAKQ